MPKASRRKGLGGDEDGNEIVSVMKQMKEMLDVGNHCAGSLGVPSQGRVDRFQDDNCQNKLSENKL